MKSLFSFLSCVAMGLTCVAQIPEYVPNEGLVAWWGMDGNGEDSHTGTYNATTLTATPATDRFGNENGALMFNGSDEMRGPGGGNMDAGLSNAITLSCWLNASQFAQNQGTAVFRHSPSGVYYNWALHFSPLGDDSNSNHPYFLAGQSLFENNGGNVSEFALQLDEWHHVVLRVVDGLVDMHVDGVEVFFNQTNGSFQTTSNAEFVFGSPSHAVNDSFTGLMDDVGVWNRGISEAEILALYQVQSPIMGCTDDTACNYNPEANFNDDSCFYGCLFCGFGTVWDAESQTCVVAIPPYLNEPGEAAILNPCYFDSNGNGLVEVTDLMNVLSVFGMACGEIPAAAFSCGDPLNYQGYDYATIQIGDQCWFAENLRAEYYQNGDAIDNGVDPSIWSSVNSGLFTPAYGDLEDVEIWGMLYNGHAVLDPRKLCPSGWHVGSDSDFLELESHLGLDEGLNDYFYRGTSINLGGMFKEEGTLEDGTGFWHSPNTGANNSSGLSMRANGWRSPQGEYEAGGAPYGTDGNFWTSTFVEDAQYENDVDGGLIRRRCDHNFNGVQRDSYGVSCGFGVRCIQD